MHLYLEFIANQNSLQFRGKSIQILYIISCIVWPIHFLTQQLFTSGYPMVILGYNKFIQYQNLSSAFAVCKVFSRNFQSVQSCLLPDLKLSWILSISYHLSYFVNPTYLVKGIGYWNSYSREESLNYTATKIYEVVVYFSLWYVCRTFLYIKPANRCQFSLFLARLVLEEFAERFDLPDCKPVRNRIVNCRNQRKENPKIKRKEINVDI